MPNVLAPANILTHYYLSQMYSIRQVDNFLHIVSGILICVYFSKEQINKTHTKSMRLFFLSSVRLCRYSVKHRPDISTSLCLPNSVFAQVRILDDQAQLQTMVSYIEGGMSHAIDAELQKAVCDIQDEMGCYRPKSNACFSRSCNKCQRLEDVATMRFAPC